MFTAQVEPSGVSSQPFTDLSPRPVTNLQRLAFIPALATTLLPTPVAQGGDVRGFTASGAAAQIEWETRFRAIPDPARLRAAMERLSARPHHVGSPYGKANAEWMRDQFASFGWEAKIEEYRVLFPTPKERRVELVEPVRFVAKLEEPVLKEDPASSQRAEQLPTYNSYSGEGDVTAPLVYVNYGVPADYEELDRRGISVRGAIVIARYGGSWRGIKPKVAAENGAIGCIIYSDELNHASMIAGIRNGGGARAKDAANADRKNSWKPCSRYHGWLWCASVLAGGASTISVENVAGTREGSRFG